MFADIPTSHTDAAQAMRIYFVGSHATGKTTLARYIAKRLELPLITEVARAVLTELETTLEALRTDLEAVSAYQERVFDQQKNLELRTFQGVFDRSFDNLAYTAEHTKSYARIRRGLTPDYLDVVRNGIVFFLRPHPELLKEDGVRAGVKWESVIRIDGMIKLMLEEHEIPYLPIDSLEMSDRISAVEFTLRLAKVIQ